MDPGATIHVLFIDDDSSYIAVARHILARHPNRRFRVTWKQDGPSALQFLETLPGVDLLFIDDYLPSTSGLEVTRMVRERKIGLPIIFLTSNRDFRLAVEAMKYGVEDYFVKDDAVDSVLPRMITSVLERVDLRRRVAEQRREEVIARKRAEAIRELVVTVCHEFNNPLAAIKISTDILLRQELPEEQRALLRGLDHSIGAVEREVNRLRDIGFGAF